MLGKRTMLAITDRQLALQRAGGSQELADELLTMLIKSLPDYQYIFSRYQKELCLHPDEAYYKDQLHKLHGALNYCATPALYKQVYTLNEQFYDLSTDQKNILLERILEEIKRLQSHPYYN